MPKVWQSKMSDPHVESQHDEIYSPLPYTHESRLVHLHPGAQNDPIQVSLHHFNVQLPPAYEALSYAWGDPSVTLPITVTGNILRVTANLECALRHLRRADRTRVLWIDAITINQQNLRERAQQVLLMSDIYTRATCVRVWLGPSDLYSDFVMKYYRDRNTRQMHRGQALSEIKKAQRHWKQRYGVLPMWKRHIPFLEALDQLELRKVADLLRVAFGALFLGQRAWFSRRWCVQEIGMAQAAIVQCGYQELEWQQMRICLSDTFAVFWPALRGTDFADVVDRSMQRLLKMEAMVDPECFSKNRLSELLVYFRHWQNGDPRDTVYALLALTQRSEEVPEVTLENDTRRAVRAWLSSDLTSRRKFMPLPDTLNKQETWDYHCRENELRPDYTKSALDVMIDAVEFVIRREWSLDLIAFPWAPNIQYLPSWIVSLDKDTILPNDEWISAFGAKSDPTPSEAQFATLTTLRPKAIVRRPGQMYGSKLIARHALVVVGLTILVGPKLHKAIGSNVSSSAPYVQNFLRSVRDPGLSRSYSAHVVSWQDRNPSHRLAILSGCRFPVLLSPFENGFVIVGVFPSKVRALALKLITQLAQKSRPLYKLRRLVIY